MTTGMTLTALVAQYLRTPTTVATDGSGNPVLTFTPALTAPEQAILADLTLMAQFGLSSSLSLIEFQALKPDLATAKAFLGIASPTAAQSNAALKATIRVIGGLLRA